MMRKIIFTVLLSSALAFPAGVSHATFPDQDALAALATQIASLD